MSYEGYICENCMEPLAGEATYVEGLWICDDCFRDYINENYSARELAVELGFDRKTVEDLYG